MPIPRNRPGEEVRLTRIASAMMSSISCGVAQPNAGNVLLGDHRIVELVVLVVEFDDRARQLGAFLDTEALRQRSGRHIPHHHLQRHDSQPREISLFAHVETADEVGGHPDIVEVLKQVLRKSGC